MSIRQNSTSQSHMCHHSPNLPADTIQHGQVYYIKIRHINAGLSHRWCSLHAGAKERYLLFSDLQTISFSYMLSN